MRWTIYDHAPRIALVTPSFNQAPVVGSTVEGVLSQNYPDLAYVVQDGGSKDRTTEVLAGFGAKLQWTSAPDGGQTAAINAGFAKVEGDVMAYLNSDDILLPGSLAAVAHAFADNLITRAADVVLKERRRLVLITREAPLNLAHIRNMAAVTEMGGVIFPPVPALYTRAKTIDDLVNHTVGRVLDLFSVEHEAIRRWQGMKHDVTTD